MILKNAKVNGKVLDIKINNGVIVAFNEATENENVIDLNGYDTYPGLIDIHSHGCIGLDTMDAYGLSEMSEYQAKNGVTSWMPTTMTMDYTDIEKTVSQDISSVKGAEILGFHMEGPYISKEFKGAQNGKHIKDPNIAEFRSLKSIKMVTVAPELSGAMDFIRSCNAIVSLGHTSADYATGMEAFRCGAKCLTHVFNAMPPLHHRAPSVIGAAIESDGYVQVICDGYHIHKSVITALYRTFGSDRMILISDSMRATGMPDGEYQFGGQIITVKNKIARTDSGSIAGSTHDLFSCVRKAVEFGIPKSDAFKMASYTPATLIEAKNKGRIEIGADADLISVDSNMNLVFSMAKGKIYKNVF